MPFIYTGGAEGSVRRQGAAARAVVKQHYTRVREQVLAALARKEAEVVERIGAGEAALLEEVQQRQADAAARATRWERPPSPTRPSIKRACKAK